MVQHSTAISLTELHRAMSLPKSTMLMLLNTLELRGDAAHNPAHAYRLTRLPGKNNAHHARPHRCALAH